MKDFEQLIWISIVPSDKCKLFRAKIEVSKCASLSNAMMNGSPQPVSGTVKITAEGAVV